MVQLYKTMLANACRQLRSRMERIMEAGINLLSKAGCRYTKEHVCKISCQYIHFHRSFDSFCKARTFVLIYHPHPGNKQNKTELQVKSEYTIHTPV